MHSGVLALGRAPVDIILNTEQYARSSDAVPCSGSAKFKTINMQLDDKEVCGNIPRCFFSGVVSEHVLKCLGMLRFMIKDISKELRRKC